MNEEALCSILCEEKRWCFDIELVNIKFNKDNTGVLSAGGGFAFWIISEFEWKSTAIEPLLDHDVTTGHEDKLDHENPDNDKTPQDHKSPHLLGQLNLKITLTKRVPTNAREMERNPMVNGGSLTDDAFQPKIFTIRIEQGIFELPATVTYDSKPYGLKWTRRLVFDISPYPPVYEWKKTKWNRESGVWFWDFKEFVGKSPEVENFVAMHSSGNTSTVVRQRDSCNEPSSSSSSYRHGLDR